MQKTVQMCKRLIFKYACNHFLFSSKEGAEISYLGGLKIPHGQQQSLMVSWLYTKTGTKLGRKCSHSTSGVTRGLSTVETYLKGAQWPL